MKANKNLEVLIVEDDLIVSRLHKFSLKSVFGKEIGIVENGREALEVLDEVAVQKEKVLVLLDLNMPVLDGWDFLELCHSRSYADKLIIVLVTSSLYNEDRKRALKYPRVMGYYSKPLKKEDVLQILQHSELSPLIP